MSTMKPTPDLAVIYYDRTDPRNKGWAYNVVVDGEHTSGALESRRERVGLTTLLRQLRREFPRTGLIAIPAEVAWMPTRDGNGWEARS